MSRSGLRRGSSHERSYLYGERDSNEICSLDRSGHEDLPCVTTQDEPHDGVSLAPGRPSSSRRKDSSLSSGKRGKHVKNVAPGSESVVNSVVPISGAPVSSGSSRDGRVVLPIQELPGVGEGHPDPGLTLPRVELADNSRKLSSLPLGREFQPPVTGLVSDLGNPGGVVDGGSFDAGPVPPSSGPGVTDFLAGLSTSTGVRDAQLSYSCINSGPAFHPGQLPGPGPIRSSPECAGSGFPGGVLPRECFAGQATGFQAPFPSGSGYRVACGQPSLGHPNQPADGFGYRQHPGSCGPSPHMSGFPPGGSGGPPMSFGLGGQPQSQAGQFDQFWGHSQPAGPFPFPQGYGFNPMAFPAWNPWGLVSPSRRRFGSSADPLQRSASSGATVAGPKKVCRTFRTSASRADSFVSGSKGRAVTSKSKPAATVVRRSAPKRRFVEPLQDSPELVPMAGPFHAVETSCPASVEAMDCEDAGMADEEDVVHLSPGCSDIDAGLSGSSDDDPLGGDSQDEGDPEAAEAEAQHVLSGMRALRADVSRILGEKVCPPPSASSIPESTTLLGSLVAPRASAQSDRSLPEGTIVSSALATAQSRVLEKNSSSTRTPGFAGLQLSVGDLSEVHPSDYATHDGLLVSQPARLESRELAAWPGKSVDQVVFGSKEHHKMERLLRLSIQILSYIDFLTVCLYRVSDVPEGRISETEQADIQDRMTSALNGALRALAALQVSLLVNVLLARRFSVLKNRPVDEPYRSRLLTAPFSGSTLFGGSLPSVQKDLKEDSVASALLVKRIQAEKARTSQGSAPPKKKAKPSATQTFAQPKAKPSFKGNKGKGKKGKNPPGGKKKSS
ncbi:hypothetical protein CI610_02733 [invertebrate metagenome]|uniref:Uncharacterized protein n=1 Tax=invertebrate metagenome TaxID=1711999 RepID=A0A2H9T553_9ZZZZ